MKYRVDQNQKEIIEHLTKHGFQVISFADKGSGFPDLMVIRANRVVLIEAKFGEKAEIKKSQMTFIGNYKGFIGFATNPREALSLSLMPDIYGLKQSVKDKITAFALTYDKPKMHFQSFKKEIGL